MDQRKTQEIKKYFKLHENKKIIYQNVWIQLYICLEGDIALNAYV